MNTPQKKGTKAKQALPNNPQKNEKEVEVTFVKNATEKPRIDIRNLPYSKNGKGDIFIMSNGKANAVKNAGKTAEADNLNAPIETKQSNTPGEDEILKRIKSYTDRATSQTLNEDESQMLAKLLLKALAPPAEMVFIQDGSDEDFSAMEAFANYTEADRIRNDEAMGKIITNVSMALGKELGYFMVKNNYHFPSSEVVNAFCEANNLPPDLFTKGIVICHIFFKEFIAQGCHPIIIMLNAYKILSTPQKLVEAIEVAARYYYDQALRTNKI